MKIGHTIYRWIQFINWSFSTFLVCLLWSVWR